MAVGQTIVSYGNFQIRRCLSVDARWEPVYDIVSQTDFIFWRVTVKVVGYIHGFPAWCQLHTPFLTSDGVQGPIESASLQHVGMRVNLPPRMQFTYRIGADQDGNGGYVNLYCEPSTERPLGITHMDVNNGPRCKLFVITGVYSDNVMRVEAEFEICKVECQVNADIVSASGTDVGFAGTVPESKTTQVLSNRWSVSDEIDATLKTIRTYQGCIRIAASKVDPLSGIDINSFRDHCTPVLQPGLRRDLISFVVSPDGLNMNYLIRDVEVVDSAPPPAKRWSVVHSEEMDQALRVRASCDVTLEGDRNCSKADLIQIGLNVITAKILANEPGKPNQVFMSKINITDYIGDDLVVSLSASALRLPKKVDEGGEEDVFGPWMIGAEVIGKRLRAADVYLNGRPVPGVSDVNFDGSLSFGGLEPSTGLEGSEPYYEGPVELIGAFLPYLQSPCNDLHKIVPDAASLTEDENEAPYAYPRTTIVARVDPYWTESNYEIFSEAATDAIYTEWKMESIYKDRSMKLALPIAASSYAYSYLTTKIVTLARPQARRIVRATAERVGQWPEMPSATQIEALVGNTPNFVQTYLGRKRRFGTPFYTAGGQKVYRMAIEFYFALNRMPDDSDELIVGRSMWTTDGDMYTSSYATMGWV